MSQSAGVEVWFPTNGVYMLCEGGAGLAVTRRGLDHAGWRGVAVVDVIKALMEAKRCDLIRARPDAPIVPRLKLNQTQAAALLNAGVFPDGPLFSPGVLAAPQWGTA